MWIQRSCGRESEIRAHCVTGPVKSVQGMGLLLGLVCDRPADEVRDALLSHDILTGTSADPGVLRLLPPLVLQSKHVTRLADALNNLVLQQSDIDGPLTFES